MSQKIKSKEEFLKVFNEFTNNIFEPDSSEIIKKIKSFSLTPNTAKETILKNIIDPINRQNRLKLGYFPISHIIPKRDRKGKKLAITSNHENIYLTDLFSANVTKKLLIASKISEQFKENYSDINKVLNVIDKIDLDKGKDNALQIINEIDTKYKIILIDITKKENKTIKELKNQKIKLTVTRDKGVLSHQRINVVFNHFKIPDDFTFKKIKKELKLIKVHKDKINGYGFPKVIVNYLNSSR